MICRRKEGPMDRPTCSRVEILASSSLQAACFLLWLTALFTSTSTQAQPTATRGTWLGAATIIRQTALHTLSTTFLSWPWKHSKVRTLSSDCKTDVKCLRDASQRSSHSMQWNNTMKTPTGTSSQYNSQKIQHAYGTSKWRVLSHWQSLLVKPRQIRYNCCSSPAAEQPNAIDGVVSNFLHLIQTARLKDGI